jgi:ribonuclease P/MRP protein subunit POP5
MKLKPLLPTLREKKRYLAFEILASTEFSWQEIKTAVHKAIAMHIGRVGLAEAGMLFVEHNKNKAVLRTSHTTLNTIKAALLFITEINNQRVIVRSIAASGMLAKAVDHIKEV